MRLLARLPAWPLTWLQTFGLVLGAGCVALKITGAW